METTEYLYPFDPTGTATTNKIVGEHQIISPPDWMDFYFIIPKIAPFFREGLKVVHQESGSELVEGIDYHLTHRFTDASVQTAKNIYGSITFLDKSMTGAVMVTYQCLGGRWTIDEQKAIEILSNTSLNPRVTTWEQVVGMPVAFPPIDHDWHLDDLVGMSEVVDSIVHVAEALGATGDGAGESHISNRNNPHGVTKEQVGLGSVANYPLANLTEAQEGTASNRYMTPERVKQAIDVIGGGLVSAHADQDDNPHNVTKDQVGLGSVGNYPIASTAEAVAGTASNRYMSPQRVREAIESMAGDTIAGHASNRENPHRVTAEQVGLGSVANYPVATAQQARDGTSDGTYMTPLKTKQAIDSLSGGLLDNHLNATNPHRVTAEDVDAYSKDEMNTLLLGKLSVGATAADSLLLDGMDLSEIIEEARTNLSGDYPSQLDIPSHEDGVKYIRIVGNGAIDPTIAPRPEFEGDPEPYEQEFDDDGNLIRFTDVVFLLVGTEENHFGPSTVQLVRMGRKPKGDVEVINLTDAPTDTEIGYTVGVDGSYHIWLKSGPRRVTTTITTLNSAFEFDLQQAEFDDEPVGIVYVQPSTVLTDLSRPFATKQQAEDGEDETVVMSPLRTREATYKTLEGAGFAYDAATGKWKLDAGQIE